MNKITISSTPPKTDTIKWLDTSKSESDPIMRTVANKEVLKTTSEILVENIRKVCNKSKYNTEELADRIGVSARQLARYKSGHSQISPTTLHTLCKTLFIPINLMFEEDMKLCGRHEWCTKN